MNIVIKKKLSSTEKIWSAMGDRTHECLVWSPTPLGIGHSGSEVSTQRNTVVVK